MTTKRDELRSEIDSLLSVIPFCSTRKEAEEMQEEINELQEKIEGLEDQLATTEDVTSEWLEDGLEHVS